MAKTTNKSKGINASASTKKSIKKDKLNNKKTFQSEKKDLKTKSDLKKSNSSKAKLSKRNEKRASQKKILKRINKKIKNKVLPIEDSKIEIKSIDDTIAKAAPIKDTREWKSEKKVEVLETKKENQKNERRFVTQDRLIGNNKPVQIPQSNAPLTIQKTNTTLEESVENDNRTENISSLLNDITYQKIQSLTQKLFEGKLTEREYQTLWNYHQIFRDEKSFLGDYASRLNFQQRNIFERAQYLIKNTPQVRIDYNRPIQSFVTYNPSSSQRQMVSYSPSIPINLSETKSFDISRDSVRRTKDRDRIALHKIKNEDYIPKTSKN